ncbi:MAG: hypothetical protein IJJ41_05665 [Clostridia bacterium]|nr:hypothetical protein [Clostridia bacterium]MBR0415506.1 hypothetical protein [Clostridia bacterium]
MNKVYNEPTFEVVIFSAQDVLATSSVVENPTYNQGQFESNTEPFGL